MPDTPDLKDRLKILIAVAWIDGKVQSQERSYLLKLAEKEGLLEDSEIKPLLHGLRSVSVQNCYDWIEAYLGKNPTAETANELIEAISGLIYSDGDIASEEANLVSRLITYTSQDHSQPVPLHESLLNAVKQLYQRWQEAHAVD